MAEDFDPSGELGKELAGDGGITDPHMVTGMRIVDARLATAALLGALQRCGDCPKQSLLEVHAAAKRLEAAITRWEAAARCGAG